MSNSLAPIKIEIQPNYHQPYNQTQELKSSPRPYSYSIPKIIVILLILLTVQLVFGITALIMTFVLGAKGFKSSDISSLKNTCDGVPTKGTSLSISLTMIIVCVVCTCILLAFILRAFLLLWKASGTGNSSSSLTPLFYRLVTPNVCRAAYIVQSLSLMTTIVIFVGYLLGMLVSPQKCPTLYSQLGVACILLAASASVWLIIVVLCCRSKIWSAYKYCQEETSPEARKYESNETIQPHRYRNVAQKTVVTRGDNTSFIEHVQDPRSPEIQNPIPYSYTVQVVGNNAKQFSRGFFRPFVETQENIQNRHQNQINTPNQPSHQSPKAAIDQIPVQRQESYDSPYKRISQPNDYEGTKEPEWKMRGRVAQEIQLVGQEEKYQETRKSPKSPLGFKRREDNVEGDDQYFRELYRDRAEPELKDLGGESPSRKIFPEGNTSSNPMGVPFFQGGKSRHRPGSPGGTQMVSPKQNLSSDEKKKRKGMLNQFIRGKYMEN